MARRQHRIDPERLNFDAIISYQAQTENPDRDEEGLEFARVVADSVLLGLLVSSLTVILIVGAAVIR